MIITFKVQECQPIYINFDFETSDNEGELHVFGGLKNLMGHAESLECSHLMGSLGTRKTELRYTIPLVHYLQVGKSFIQLSFDEVNIFPLQQNNTYNIILITLYSFFQKTAANRAAYFIASVFNHTHRQTWSSLQFGDMGFKFSGIFQPFSWLKQTVQWRASWRQLQPLTSNDKNSFKGGNGKANVSRILIFGF